jgi:hypothetical protein
VPTKQRQLLTLTLLQLPDIQVPTLRPNCALKRTSTQAASSVVTEQQARAPGSTANQQATQKRMSLRDNVLTYRPNRPSLALRGGTDAVLLKGAPL